MDENCRHSLIETRMNAIEKPPREIIPSQVLHLPLVISVQLRGGSCAGQGHWEEGNFESQQFDELFDTLHFLLRIPHPLGGEGSRMIMGHRRATTEDKKNSNQIPILTLWNSLQPRECLPRTATKCGRNEPLATY